MEGGGGGEVARRDRAKVKVAEVRRIGEDREKGRDVVWVRLGNEKQKWKVMEKKEAEG